MKSLQTRAFSYIDILIIVCVMVAGGLLALAVHKYIRSSEIEKGQVCDLNLRQVEGAMDQWRKETHGPNLPDPQFADLVPNYLTAVLICPSGGTYSITEGAVTCSVRHAFE